MVNSEARLLPRGIQSLAQKPVCDTLGSGDSGAALSLDRAASLGSPRLYLSAHLHLAGTELSLSTTLSVGDKEVMLGLASLPPPRAGCAASLPTEGAFLAPAPRKEMEPTSPGTQYPPSITASTLYALPTD